MSLLLKLIFAAFGLWLFHCLALWMESKGWVYYKKKPERGGGAGNALQELNALMRPSTKHVQEATKDKKEEAAKDDQ